MLAVVGMSAAWRSYGMMPQFFVVKDGKRFSLPPFLFCFPSVAFVFRSVSCPALFCILDLLVLLLGRERIIPFLYGFERSFSGCLSSSEGAVGGSASSAG